ncbi:MAG: TraB/GumN family protein, partial [Panacagrimonas sp.]
MKMIAMRASTLRLLLTLLCLICGSPLQAAGDPPEAHETYAAGDAPFLWKVQGPGATHYLLGSMHLMPGSAYPLPASIQHAYAQTRGLILETDPAALEAPELQARMVDAGVTGRGLVNEIDPALYARVRRQAQASDLPPTVCDRFRAWFCALSLTLYEFQRAGMEPKFGIDQHFYRRARADRRPVSWLEEADTQFRLFSNMDANLSAQFLASSLDDLSQEQWSPEALMEVWGDNDSPALAALLESTRRDFPQTYARLLADRNRAWMHVLVNRL